MMKDDLLFKYFNNKATEEEMRQIGDWLDADASNRKEFDTAHTLFNIMQLSSDRVTGALAEKKIVEMPKWRKAVKYAAAIAIIAVAGVTGMFVEKEVTYRNMSAQVNVIEVPAGQRMAMTLQDGTEIHLNGGSRMEYPLVFDRKQRRIKLSGEAFFDVSHDDRHPFVVETFASEVEVLGTKFNVHADEEKGHFSTTLLCGKVRVTMGDSGQQVVLNPDESAEIVGDKLVVSAVSAHDAVCWKDGYISLKDVDFEELMCRIESMYDVNIVIDRKDHPEISFVGGKIRVAEGLDFALRILQSGSDFTYEIDRSTNTVYIR